MKNIKTLLIILLGYLSFSALGSDTLYVRFNNFYVKAGSPNDTLIFDVEYKSFTSGTYLVAFQNDINFNTAAFGINAKPVVLQPLALVTPIVVQLAPPTNPISSRFRYVRSQMLPPYDPATLSLVPSATWAGLMRYKMLVLDNTQLAGLSFQITAPGMTGNQKFVKVVTSTASTYVPVVAKNDLLTLPTTLTNNSLMFSEIGDPSNSSTNFVEVYNAGNTAVNFGIYPWYLSFNAGSSVQLTGTIAAGAKYTIAYDAVDFTPNLTSALVGTGGTTQYLLSTFGDYTSGTSIDKYDGSGTGIDFTGKHAVRHYNTAGPNTTFTPAEWVVSAAQNIDMTPGSHHSELNWGGATDSEWRAKGNWAEGFIPDAGHNVYITSTSNIPEISAGDNGYCHNLAITGGLIIKSLPGADGSLITYGTVTGYASVQRYLAADRYWYVSQPVTSAVAGVFLHTWMFTYNELTSAWGAFIEPETTPLVRMQGYAVWTSSINPWHYGWAPMGDTTTSYNGTLNTGDISKALTKGGNGWNFVGNPYPSAVDWEAAGWTKTSLATNSYSVWDGTTYGTYTAGSGGTNGTTKYIPSAQGFFVQTTAAGSLGVSNAVRTHSTQAFWKAEENMSNRLSLTVSNGDVNDETVIYFNNEATADLDYSFDAPKLMAPAAPQLYSMLADEAMAINAFNNPAQTPVVTLGVNAPAAGEYTITASNMESFDATVPIFLEDLLTGDKINLREMSSYAFTAVEGASERFLVHFTTYQGIGDKPVSEVNSIYAINRDIYVDFNSVKGEISIYNILGQEISRSSATNGLNMISVPQGNAVYIVKVISDNATVTEKVFVK